MVGEAELLFTVAAPLHRQCDHLVDSREIALRCETGLLLARFGGGIA
jgi:hypothetical protein